MADETPTPEPTHLFTSFRYDPLLLVVPDAFSLSERAGYNAVHSTPFYMPDFHRDRMLRAARHWKWDDAIAALEGEEGIARVLEAATAAIDRAVAEQGSAPTTKLPPKRIRIVISRDGGGKLEAETYPVKANQVKATLGGLFPAKLPPPEGMDPPVPAAAARRPGSSDDGDHGTSEESLPPLAPLISVVLDSVGTKRSPLTHFKTLNRTMYDSARERAQLGPAPAPGGAGEVLIVSDRSGEIMEGSTTTPYFWRGGRWVTPPVPAKYSSEAGSGGNDGTTRRYALER